MPSQHWTAHQSPQTISGKQLPPVRILSTHRPADPRAHDFRALLDEGVRNQYDGCMPLANESHSESLVFINGPQPGSAIPLDHTDADLTFGRDEARDVPLDDPVASRLHARIWFDGQNWQIEDCGSSNGTKVNSEWVERAVLESGDLIRIGDTLLVYLTQEESLPAPKVRASVLAGTTSSVAMSATDRDAVLSVPVEEVNEWPAHLLPLVYQLSKLLTKQPNIHRVAKLVAEATAQATQAQHVVIWLTGRSGRLRRVARVKPPNAKSDRDHLVASLVMERDEAILAASEPNTNPEGPVLAAPIPGQARPRGAIECYLPADERPFTRADVEFLSAVAHQLGMAVDILQHRYQLEQANANLKSRLRGSQRLMGDSPAMTNLTSQLHRVAPTDSNVLILGESGTGKELVANSIHELSKRAVGPFVAVNCAAFSESLLESELFGHEAGAFTGANARRPGQFERAHTGTVFLDEVGELSPNCQAKLLRILEGHPFTRLGGNEPVQVDVRVVAATHRDLVERCRDGDFRQDLYFRLRVIELQLPALRNRGEDILKLALRFLDEFRRQVGRGPAKLSAEAAEQMLAYSWPGNVRELKNAIERAVVLGTGPEVTAADLALRDQETDESPRMISLADAELRHIQAVVAACGGNKTKACSILGIGRGTLYAKLKKVE